MVPMINHAGQILANLFFSSTSPMANGLAPIFYLNANPLKSIQLEYLQYILVVEIFDSHDLFISARIKQIQGTSN